MPDTQSSVPPQRILWLSRADVEAASLSPTDTIACIRDALVWRAEGRVEMPPKFGVHPPEGRHVHAMPAVLPGSAGFGMKWIGDFPNNRTLGLPTLSALIVLNDPHTGAVLTVMDGTVVTAMRTAAMTAVSLQACARPEAAVATIVGTGVQARAHLAMLRHAMPSLATVFVVGRDGHAARQLCDEMGPRVTPTLVPTADRGDAARAADVIITVTTSVTTRLLEPEWLRPGVTVVVLDNGGKETGILHVVDRVLVDDRRPFGDAEVLARFTTGVPPIAAEIGEILLGRREGRSSAEQRILVLNLGIAACDIALAEQVYARASSLGRGILVPS